MIITDAIYKALKTRTTFAAYIEPGKTLSNMRFIASVGDRKPISDVTFRIVPWDCKLDESIDIEDTVSVSDYLKLDDSEISSDVAVDYHPYAGSTPYLLYKGQVMSIVDDLKGYRSSKDLSTKEAKTVLSRVICGEIENEDIYKTWVDVLIEYFEIHPNTFRYIYFTSQTGCWLGASPELLLKVDKNTHEARTMMLAGTRSSSETGCWDKKNYFEHMPVETFVLRTLHRLGLKTEFEYSDDVKFGSVSHLCNHINFNLENTPVEEVIDRLSPTPALSGFPREDAMARINHLERHERRCYGGYVAIDNTGRFMAYVNLRCLNFLGNKYCIYTGGGITHRSTPEDEWAETVAKSSTLKKILEPHERVVNNDLPF